jgi:hypothetical protein
MQIQESRENRLSALATETREADTAEQTLDPYPRFPFPAEATAKSSTPSCPVLQRPSTSAVAARANMSGVAHLYLIPLHTYFTTSVRSSPLPRPQNDLHSIGFGRTSRRTKCMVRERKRSRCLPSGRRVLKPPAMGNGIELGIGANGAVLHSALVCRFFLCLNTGLDWGGYATPHVLVVPVVLVMDGERRVWREAAVEMYSGS